MKRVLIADKAHTKLIQGLEEGGWSVDYKPAIQKHQVTDIIGNYRGLILNSKVPADENFLRKAVELKFIGRLGSGLDLIDLECAKQLGIAVLNSPEGNRDAVAEHTIGMILSLLHKIHQADRHVRALKWERNEYRPTELKGKVLGIIGFGNTGTQLAIRLKDWGIQILAYDPYCLHFERYPFVRNVPLEMLKQDSDIISFHVQLTPETKYYFDKEFVGRCKKGVIIVNTSRGKVVLTKDLLWALKSGSVAGACLDVLEEEPPIESGQSQQRIYDELFALDQVVFSPHTAGRSYESIERIAEVLLGKIRTLRLK